jgi:UDP:flavonoid glycosyltransferase YjiC (YdhE family)
MRVLVTTPAGLGHVHPMVPLARAIAERGHDVLWALPADGVAHVEPTGLRTLVAGRAGLTRPAEMPARFPELAGLSPADAPDVIFGKMFGALATPAILADLEPVAREWKPDLVVSDAAEFAGHLVAADLGVPSVTKGFGPLLPERRVALAGREVADLWRTRGLEPRDYGGAYHHLYLDVYPPGLAADAAHVPRRQLLRPENEDGHTAPSAPLPLPTGRPGAPLAYVTMGTVFHDSGPLASVLAALADVDVRVLATVGPAGDPARLGAQPPHVRVETYVPQTRVLAQCDVVVSHAGSGTVLATARLGLPQLCLPQGADQFLNARAIASSGAGIALEPHEASVEAMRDAVARLLGDSSYRTAAARVGAAIEAMPPASDVAAVLETLA